VTFQAASPYARQFLETPKPKGVRSPREYYGPRTTRGSVQTPLVSRGEQLLNGDLAVSLPKGADAGYGFIHFFLAPIYFRYDPGDGAAVPGDDERLTPLHVVEQLRQMGFGFGGLNLTHFIF
jgi:hypothetical protein